MNHLHSTTTQSPPPLPTAVRNQAKRSQRTKIVLTPSRIDPYRRATAVIAAFTLVASLLTFKIGWGINLPLLAASSLGVGFWRNSQLLYQHATRIQLAVWLALAVAVVLHFDPWTIVPFVLVTLVLLGSLFFGRAVDPMRAIARSLVQSVAIPWAYFKAIRFGRASILRNEGIVHTIIRLAAFPLFIAIGFGTLYVWSNQKLSQWSFNFFDQLLAGDWFLDMLHFGWCLFISSLVGSALVYTKKKQNRRLLKSIGDTPAQLAASASRWSPVSIALVMVNVLALVLNTVDSFTTWMGDVSTSGAELKHGVHAGTYTLIAAVVLAASYLLYNFRVQPKDYERARLLAMAWLGQNLMMVFTVALRNYHYTDAYGLTIKRIGVWLFLICTATGLYFLGRQVGENGSVERLIRRQAWAVYLVLATAAIPNWPGLITRYNYQEARMVLDEDYLWSLRPYNVDVWAEYDKHIVRRASANYYASTAGWFESPKDFRAWDYRAARRAVLRKALPVLQSKAVEAIREPSAPVLEKVNVADEINYDVEPKLEIEILQPKNK